MRKFLPLILLVVVGCSNRGTDSLPVGGPQPKTAFPSPPTKAADEEIIGDVAPIHPLKKEIALARGKLARLEKRHADLQELIDKAQAERDDILSRLREMGVTSSADLRSTPQAKQLTDALQKSVREIEILQRDDGLFTDAVTQTKTLIRSLERAVTLDGAGVGEEELAQLAEKTLESYESSRNKPFGPLDPLQQAHMLDQELARIPFTGKRTSRPVSLATQLVGKWQVAEGMRKGTIEFTKGGTALVAWSDGLRNALGESDRRATLKYSLTGKSLRVEEPGDGEYRQIQVINIDVVSLDEMIFVVEKQAMSYCWLEGRATRMK